MSDVRGYGEVMWVVGKYKHGLVMRLASNYLHVSINMHNTGILFSGKIQVLQMVDG